MYLTEFIPRALIHTDWITGLFLLLLFLLVFAKMIHPDKFNKTFNLFNSNKFFLNYSKEPNLIFNSFAVVMFGVQLISFTLLGYLLTDKWALFLGLTFTAEYGVFFGIIALFLIGKLLLIKLLGFLFNFTKLLDQFIFFKNAYLNVIAIYLIPIIALLAYSQHINKLIIYLSLIYLLFLFMFSYLQILLNNKKIIYQQFFYFILYICTLEIAPLLIIMKLVF